MLIIKDQSLNKGDKINIDITSPKGKIFLEALLLDINESLTDVKLIINSARAYNNGMFKLNSVADNHDDDKSSRKLLRTKIATTRLTGIIHVGTRITFAKPLKGGERRNLIMIRCNSRGRCGTWHNYFPNNVEWINTDTTLDLDITISKAKIQPKQTAIRKTTKTAPKGRAQL